MAEQALYKILSTAAPVTDLVGTRLYPVTLPEGTVLPALSYQRISGPRVQTLDGATPTAFPRVQVDCYAATYAQAAQLAGAVSAAVRRFRGSVTVGSGQSQETETVATRVLDERDDYEPQTRIHQRSLDVRVWLKEG